MPSNFNVATDWHWQPEPDSEALGALRLPPRPRQPGNFSTVTRDRPGVAVVAAAPDGGRLDGAAAAAVVPFQPGRPGCRRGPDRRCRQSRCDSAGLGA